MSRLDDGFEDRLKIFRDEIFQAEMSFYTFRTVQDFLADNEAEASRSVLFWIAIRNSLVVNLFMTLGRIFEDDKKSHSVDAFLKFCKTYNHIFSKKNLRARKSAAMAAAELDKYMEKIPQVTVRKDDFEVVETEMAAKKLVVEKAFRKIRHRVITHKDVKTVGREEELLSKAAFHDIEQVIVSLNKVAQTFWELYANGTRIDLARVKISSAKDMITRDAGEFLRKNVPAAQA